MKRSHSNDVRNGLTPGQERAIRAMLTAPSVAAAARQADVGQSTPRRWLREDDNFQTELRQIREEALSRAVAIGERRKPEPRGQPGFLRVDTVHQGDSGSRQGIYHINAVDTVTQNGRLRAVAKPSPRPIYCRF